MGDPEAAWPVPVGIFTMQRPKFNCTGLWRPTMCPRRPACLRQDQQLTLGTTVK